MHNGRAIPKDIFKLHNKYFHNKYFHDELNLMTKLIFQQIFVILETPSCE